MSNMTQQNKTTQINLSTLRRLMDDAFSSDELRILCADLGIKYDNIPGGDIKISKIMGIIEHMQHEKRLPELVTYLEVQRPRQEWQSVYEEIPEVTRGGDDPPGTKRDKTEKRWLIGAVALAAVLVIAGVFWVVNSGQMCAYPAEDDYAAIVQIIRAESQAVNEGNLEIIKDIFAPDAYIKQTEIIDGKPHVNEWLDPLSRYSTLFENTTFSEARHTDMEGSITGNHARFTSGSSGSFVNDDGYGEYENKAGIPDEEEVWTLEKNFWGCWQITRFEFH